jgi:hypothetical protein
LLPTDPIPFERKPGKSDVRPSISLVKRSPSQGWCDWFSRRPRSSDNFKSSSYPKTVIFIFRATNGQQNSHTSAIIVIEFA